MGILADIGRARPADALASTIGTMQAIDTYKQNIALNDQKMALIGLQMEKAQQTIKRNALALKEQERQAGENNKPIAVETLASNFEGGQDGPLFKMIYDYTSKLGFIDKSQGGLGVIRKGDLPIIKKQLEDPNFAMRLSRARIDMWRNQLNQAQSALKEKPNDKNAQEALQQAQVGLNQALYHDSEMSKWMKDQAAVQAAQATATGKERVANINKAAREGSARIAGRSREKAARIKINNKVPAGYGESLANALDAIDKGVTSKAVYKKMVKAFPSKAKELKSLIVDSKNLPDAVKSAVSDAVDRIQSGEKSATVYREIASEYPKYSATIKRILLTPLNLNSVDFSALFGK
jgi:hypothetical protein